MEFEIYRTSSIWSMKGGKSEKPCDEAYQKGIAPTPKKDWFIRIETLDELINLATKQEESLIISPKSEAYDYPSIEIYDNYRE